MAASRALERAGREERIDHRSLAEQGSDRLPQVHLGPHSAALERRGIVRERRPRRRTFARWIRPSRAVGTIIEDELQAQRNRWQHDQVRLPGLEEKAASLGRLLDLAAKALDGFAQEQEREHD